MKKTILGGIVVFGAGVAVSYLGFTYFGTSPRQTVPMKTTGQPAAHDFRNQWHSCETVPGMPNSTSPRDVYQPQPQKFAPDAAFGPPVEVDPTEVIRVARPNGDLLDAIKQNSGFAKMKRKVDLPPLEPGKDGEPGQVVVNTFKDLAAANADTKQPAPAMAREKDGLAPPEFVVSDDFLPGFREELKRCPCCLPENDETTRETPSARQDGRTGPRRGGLASTWLRFLQSSILTQPFLPTKKPTASETSLLELPNGLQSDQDWAFHYFLF